jgi:hypothetical protein
LFFILFVNLNSTARSRTPSVAIVHYLPSTTTPSM